MTGLYVGAMGMIANGLKLDVQSNNLANSQTMGYKSDQVTFRLFEDANQVRINEPYRSTIGRYEESMYADHVETNFQAGSMLQSKEATDMALLDNPDSGKVSFFIVSQNGEERLTRNGAFHVDENRILRTSTGATVLDVENQPISIPQGAPFAVRDTGDIQNPETGEIYATLRLASVAKEDLGLLEKAENATFKVMDRGTLQREFGPIGELERLFDTNPSIRSTFGSKERIRQIANGETTIVGPFEGAVKQNMLETSNVDYVKEMAELINTQRSFQAAQKVLKSMSEVLEKDASGMK